jgi:hypothetical protein
MPTRRSMSAAGGWAVAVPLKEHSDNHPPPAAMMMLPY